MRATGVPRVAATVRTCLSIIPHRSRRPRLRGGEPPARTLASAIVMELRADIDAEHRAIVEAVLAGDADRATGEMARHIEHTTAAIAEVHR